MTASELLPVPDDASGLIFVRRQDSLVHLDEQGQQEYNGYQLKILHPNALQAGNLSIAWNPASGAPIVHSVKIHRDGEIIDVLQTASFEILRREDQLEAAMLDGTLTAIMRVEDLRVGDELEFAETTRIMDPTLGQYSAGLLVLAPAPLPGRFHLGLSWEEGQQPNIKMSSDFEKVAKKGNRSVNFRFDNPSVLAPPKDAPARYNWQRFIEFSDFSGWEEVSSHIGQLFFEAAKIGDNSPLKREASRIAAAHSGSLERASAALKLVQQDVRYIYVGLDGGNLTPASAEETWQRRYGDCKGKTALLLGLLAELGIQAEAVLASNGASDNGLDERLPSPNLFDHVLVRAVIDGEVYFLDGTLPPVATPSTSPVLPYEWILPLTAQGSSIEHLAWSPAERPDEIVLHEIDASAGFDEAARITNTTITRGIKGLQQQVQFSSQTREQILTSFRQHGIGDTWQSIEDVQWHYDQKARASVLAITGMGIVDWDEDDDGGRSLALPGGGFSPPERRVRPAEQDQGLPFYNKDEYDCRVTTVRLPSNTQARQWSFKQGYNARIFGQNYYRAFELRDGAIRMVRGFRVEQLEVDAVTAKKDNERIARFDNSMAWIFYDPEDANTAARNSGSVPATYEIDWTADNVPCLSPDPGSSFAADAHGFTEVAEQEPETAEAYFAQAEAFMREGKLDEGFAAIDRALELEPKNRQVWLAKAYLELRAGEVDAARLSLERIISDGADDSPGLLARGLLASMNNNPEGAIEAYGAALAKAPDNGFLYMLRASALYETEEFDLAVADANMAIKINPKFDQSPYVIKASVSAYRGDRSGVAAAIDEMLAAFPDDDETKQLAVLTLNNLGLRDRAKTLNAESDEFNESALALFNRAEMRDASDIDGKLADLSKAIELDPEYTESYHARSQLLWRNGDHDKALTDVNTALKISPEEGKLYLLKANILNSQGRKAETVKTAEELISAIPGQVYPLVAASQIFNAVGERERAYSAIDQALKIRPEAYIFLNRADLRQPSDIDGKLEDVEQALKLEPKMIEGLASKAQLLSAKGDYFSAVRIYDEMIGRDKENVFALANRGIALWKLGREDDGRDDFMRARAIAREPGILNNLCYGKALQNVALDLALEECNLALRDAPNSAHTLDSRGYLYLRMNRIDEAIADFDAVIEKMPGAESAYYGRAIAYEIKGDAAQAVEDRAKALAINAQTEERLALYGFALSLAAREGQAPASEAKASAH